MSGKMIAAIAAATVLASTGFASAQSGTVSADQARYRNNAGRYFYDTAANPMPGQYGEEFGAAPGFTTNHDAWLSY